MSVQVEHVTLWMLLLVCAHDMLNSSYMSNITCHIIQVKLLSVFPPSDNISLWVDVNLDNMAPGSAGEAVEVLVLCCLKTLHNFRQQTTPTISNAAIVVSLLPYL